MMLPMRFRDSPPFWPKIMKCLNEGRRRTGVEKPATRRHFRRVRGDTTPASGIFPEAFSRSLLIICLFAPPPVPAPSPHGAGSAGLSLPPSDDAEVYMA